MRITIKDKELVSVDGLNVIGNVLSWTIARWWKGRPSLIVELSPDEIEFLELGKTTIQPFPRTEDIPEWVKRQSKRCPLCDALTGGMRLQ